MLNIKKLSYQYGNKLKVVDGMDLSLPKGKIIGILGKNGVGKSTLLHCISGLLFPKKGEIYFNGYKPSNRTPSFLADLFLLPEEIYTPDVKPLRLAKTYPTFYPAFNSDQFVAYMEEFDVPIQNRLDEMSYGQKKKVLISLGLACNTKLIILDEPTNGHDITSKSKFRKILSRTITADKTIFISTHQIKDVENLVDQVIIMNEGKILFNQDLGKVNDRLTFNYAIDLSHAEPSVYQEESIRGYTTITANHHGGSSKIDLEILYKAVMHHPVEINQLFN